MGKATPPATAIAICPNLELEIEFHQLQTVEMGGGGFQNEVNAAGRIPLTVDLSKSPPQVSGEGELPVSGGGQAGDCAFQNSGKVVFRLQGEIRPNVDNELELALNGRRAMNITSFPPCGGGIAAPEEDIGQAVISYGDGNAIEWSWSQPMGGIEGWSKWVLHVPCEP